MKKQISLIMSLLLCSSTFAIFNIQEDQILCESRRHNGELKVLIEKSPRGKFKGSIVLDGKILARNNKLLAPDTDHSCCGGATTTYETEGRGYNQNGAKWSLHFNHSLYSGELEINTRRLENAIDDYSFLGPDTLKCKLTSKVELEDILN